MEQWTYFGTFIFIFAILYIARYIEKDNQYRLVLYLISTFIFLALAILSFNNYSMVYDVSLGTFVKYYEASETLVPFLFFGISLIFSIISGFSFMLSVGEEWARLKKGKEMRKY